MTTPDSCQKVTLADALAQGSGEFVCGGARRTFEPNNVLFVAAEVDHRFEKFGEDFAV